MRWSRKAKLSILHDAALLFLNIPIRLVYLIVLAVLELFFGLCLFIMFARLWRPALTDSGLALVLDVIWAGVLVLVGLTIFVLAIKESWNSTIEAANVVRRGVDAHNAMSLRVASQAGDLSVSVVGEGGGLTQSAEVGGMTMEPEVRLGLDEAEAQRVVRDTEHAREVPS